jgi:hypothetical protein
VRNERINFDVKRGTRSYAATAYYCPASTRKNLVMLTGAMVRSLWPTSFQLLMAVTGQEDRLLEHSRPRPEASYVGGLQLGWTRLHSSGLARGNRGSRDFPDSSAARALR